MVVEYSKEVMEEVIFAQIGIQMVVDGMPTRWPTTNHQKTEDQFGSFDIPTGASAHDTTPWPR